jgi:hypothetical protein
MTDTRPDLALPLAQQAAEASENLDAKSLLDRETRRAGLDRLEPDSDH